MHKMITEPSGPLVVNGSHNRNLNSSQLLLCALTIALIRPMDHERKRSTLELELILIISSVGFRLYGSHARQLFVFPDAYFSLHVSVYASSVYGGAAYYVNGGDLRLCR